ncbi:phosphatase PAP2 family protein [Streptomyces sp. NPDC017179]|uniref:phosphatase PAP2 family protein n=1 Tax=Streptomyces sp. NPDC017179 TaxID=3364979 RepID=UPI0037997AA2
MSTSRSQDPERAPAGRDGRRSGPLWPARVLFVLAAVAGVSAALFALITWQVVVNGPLLGADRAASRALLHPDRGSALLADLGDVRVAVPVLLAVGGWAARRARSAGNRWWWAAPCAAVLLMALLPALIIPLKTWTARHGTAVMPPGAGYYPSGHTATAAMGYGAAALVLLPWLRTALARGVLVGLCAALVLGTSYGLVRRGYHWPLDVVASWCLAVVLLSALWLLISGLPPRGPRPRPPRASPAPAATDR